MTVGRRTNAFLDPEKCWKDWNILGSLVAVQKEHIRKEKLNPKTGRPPTLSGIEKSAFSWAIHHPEEAKKDLEYAWQREGVILKDEEFKRLLVKWAKTVYIKSPNKFDNFISQSKLEEYV